MRKVTLYMILAFMVAPIFVSCYQSHKKELGVAYALAETEPDSALAFLNHIEQRKLSEEDMAKYALIYYMAQDKGTQFVPIQHRPIYIQVSKISDKKDFFALVEEPLKLKHNHKYYIGVAVMASSGNGEIHFPAYFKKGCVRNLCTDRKKNFPVTLGVSVYGMPARHHLAK